MIHGNQWQGLAVALVLTLFPYTSCLAGSEEKVRHLLDRAETQIALGISQKGAGDAFEDGLKRLDEAAAIIASAGFTASARALLIRQVSELREQLEVLVELYEERFYGFYPLARLLLPTLLDEEGDALTEQLFHPPAIAAIEAAGRVFSIKADGMDGPRVVLRSTPRDPLLENVAYAALARYGTTLPVNRHGLLKILGEQELANFDAGDVDSERVAGIMRGLNVESLIVATIKSAVGNGRDLVKYALKGDLYQRGEAIQGSPVDAAPAIRVATISAFGTILDRREQFWPIVLSELGLLLCAMAWAARVPWSTTRPLKPLYRVAIGAGLFIFGRLFTTACIVAFGRFAPDPSDMVAAAWWWPALLGLVTILFGGLFAWLAQARLTDVMPGTRGFRAVGTIFGLTALGGASYFIAPELLLNESGGYIPAVLYVFNAVALAVLFAFAVRTGPPVPTYFAVFPFFLAALLGTALIMDSGRSLWVITAFTVLLYTAAAARSRYAVAHGIEEHEPDSEAAARADHVRLQKLGEKLRK